MQNNEDRGSLSDKFRDFGAAPTDGLWNAIAGDLDNRKKRRFALWWWASSGIAATLVAFAVIVFANGNARKHDQLSALDAASGKATKHLRKVTVEQAAAALPEKDSIPFIVGQIPPWVFPFDFSGMEHFHYPTCAGSYYNSQQYMWGQNNVLYPNGLPITETGKNDSVPPSDSLVHPDTSLADATGTSARVMPKEHLSKWSIGVHIGAANGTAMFNGESSVPPTMTAGLDNYAVEYINPATAMPAHQFWSADIRVGRVLATRGFLRKFSVESGISAGLFRSGERENPNTSYASGSASAFTIGIPVALQYTVVARGRMELNAQAGTTHYLPFYQRFNYSSVNSPNIEVKEKSHSMTYVPSAQFNLGCRFRVYRRMYVDVRPEARYFFDRKANPGAAPFIGKTWWFGGTAGLTWKL